MDSVCFEEGGTIPEQVKVVNKADVVSCTGGLESGVETEESAEAP